MIGRVTGGERLQRSTARWPRAIRGADLWLLNPAGILFGPNARLDVPGSFHASTADELRFADGAVFSALDPQGSVLSRGRARGVRVPAGRSRAGIAVDRSMLEVPEGKALSLVGGDVDRHGGNSVASSGEAGTVRAGGRVTLAALGGRWAADVATGERHGRGSGTIRLTDGRWWTRAAMAAARSASAAGSWWSRTRRPSSPTTSAPSHAAGGITIEAGDHRDPRRWRDPQRHSRGNAGH